ncbi:MAG: FAD-binding protein [Armatimonadota bacterium]
MEKSTITLEPGIDIDVYRCHTLVVGSGAAGLTCALRLHDLGIEDVAILTTDAHGGTSYSSGSDKQTYYKLSVFGDTADSPIEMAHSLFDGGAMHGDQAYIESLYSLPAFYHLVGNGVPFPYNSYGAFVGYKTDHDPRQRATSAGPKTSRYMVETSTRRIKQKGIPIIEGITVVRLVKDNERVVGIVGLKNDQLHGKNLGIILFHAECIVLATGGPGELYADSVYPAGQVSCHGPALEAGASAVNLGESQFGIASTEFRWNLSGTYQQVLPAYFSRSARGDQRNFLALHYSNLPKMGSGIFLKGYQWPFSASRASGYGSSLVDMAVFQEKEAGRAVYLDFMHNPERDGQPIDMEALIPEAKDYLRLSGAVQETPYDRLAWMNPESIEIYTENGIDLHDPLEIAVCFQHNNGGLRVNDVYQTDVMNLFAIGEVAGVHGVSRPGGAALNSSQVGAMRVAQYIAATKRDSRSGIHDSVLQEAAISVLKESRAMLESSQSHEAVRSFVQKRMSDAAGMLRAPSHVSAALSDALSLVADCEKTLPGASDRSQLPRAWETRGLALTHAAFLANIDAYIRKGGGSRGSYLVVDEDEASDSGIVDSAKGVLMRYKKERIEDRSERVVVSGSSLQTSVEQVRPIPEDKSWFESTWAIWRDGKTFCDREGK